MGLKGVMEDLIADGNSVILVDHDSQILSKADWIIEMGPEAGAKGGCVTAQGTIEDIENDKNSLIGPFLSGKAETRIVAAGTPQGIAENPESITGKYLK